MTSPVDSRAPSQVGMSGSAFLVWLGCLLGQLAASTVLQHAADRAKSANNHEGENPASGDLADLGLTSPIDSRVESGRRVSASVVLVYCKAHTGQS